MQITTKRNGDITLVGIAGNLDGTTAPAAQEKILPLLRPGCRLVFEMGRCDYVSSAGLRLLLSLAKELGRVGGKGAFAALRPEIDDVMKITGFGGIFLSYPTVAEAVGSFR